MLDCATRVDRRSDSKGLRPILSSPQNRRNAKSPRKTRRLRVQKCAEMIPAARYN